MKKLEIEKTKPTFIISTFKTDIIRVGLVFSISNFFIAKTSLANKWRSFSSSYLALEQFFLTVGQNNFGNKIPILTLAMVVERSHCICIHISCHGSQEHKNIRKNHPQ